jgi:hypothetical protein
MANTFKNKITAGVGSSVATVYTCPSATTAVVIGVTLCNLKTSGVEGTLALTDASVSATVSILKSAPIPSGSSIIAVGGEQKIVLEAGDALKVTASEASAIDVMLSVLEIS